VSDPTETLRREMLATGQPEADLASAASRWSTDELREAFEVISFAAPFAMVRRKSDGVVGTVEFTHAPRFYFNFVKDARP
jgi:hypothetical protein